MQIPVCQSVTRRKTQLKKLKTNPERLAYRCETVIRKNIWELGSRSIFLHADPLPPGGHLSGIRFSDWLKSLKTTRKD
jgi:hypothetical protein